MLVVLKGVRAVVQQAERAGVLELEVFVVRAPENKS